MNTNKKPNLLYLLLFTLSFSFLIASCHSPNSSANDSATILDNDLISNSFAEQDSTAIDTATVAAQEAAKPESSSVGIDPGNPIVYEFPEAWIGTWRGTVLTYTHTDSIRTTPMELHIFATDSTDRWTWTIIYGTGTEKDVRAYELVLKDEESKHYVIDEKNSILIDSYVRGNSFCSRFAVGDYLLLCTYELSTDNEAANEMVFEITSGKLEGNKSGGTSDNIPEVAAYPISVFQKAKLYREE